MVDEILTFKESEERIHQAAEAGGDQQKHGLQERWV